MKKKSTLSERLDRLEKLMEKLMEEYRKTSEFPGMCEHANENPIKCFCEKDCYCRKAHCKGKEFLR